MLILVGFILFLKQEFTSTFKYLHILRIIFSSNWTLWEVFLQNGANSHQLKKSLDLSYIGTALLSRKLISECILIRFYVTFHGNNVVCKWCHYRNTACCMLDLIHGHSLPLIPCQTQVYSVQVLLTCFLPQELHRFLEIPQCSDFWVAHRST